MMTCHHLLPSAPCSLFRLQLQPIGPPCMSVAPRCKQRLYRSDNTIHTLRIMPCSPAGGTVLAALPRRGLPGRGGLPVPAPSAAAKTSGAGRPGAGCGSAAWCSASSA